MSDFHSTRMGQKFFESTMPAIAEALNTIAKVMKASHEDDLEEYTLLLKLKYAVARQENNSQEVKDLLAQIEAKT